MKCFVVAKRSHQKIYYCGGLNSASPVWSYSITSLTNVQNHKNLPSTQDGYNEQSNPAII